MTTLHTDFEVVVVGYCPFVPKLETASSEEVGGWGIRWKRKQTPKKKKKSNHARK